MSRYGFKWSLEEKFGLGIIVLWAVIVLAAVGGWIANVVKLIGMLNSPITAMFVARIIGVVAAPFGSILGYF